MPTPDKNKAALEGLIAKANAATGGADTTVTDAVDTLIAGFGQGGGENPLDYAARLDATYFMANFGDGIDFVVRFGAKSGVALAVGIGTAFKNASGLNSVTVIFEGLTGGKASINNAFKWEFGTHDGLTKIDISGFCSHAQINNIYDAFGGRRDLKEIVGVMDCSLCPGFSGAFTNCLALESVQFAEETILKSLSFPNSPNLTAKTIQSIIDGLADLTGGTAQTLTLHADVKSKLTETQISAITGKNWTLA